jgi:hypothetical protein
MIPNIYATIQNSRPNRMSSIADTENETPKACQMQMMHPPEARTHAE